MPKNIIVVILSYSGEHHDVGIEILDPPKYKAEGLTTTLRHLSFIFMVWKK